MLTLTNAAGAHLARKLARAEAAADVAIRFIPKEHGRKRRRWGLRLDTLHPGDETFVHDGKMVLVLDEAVSELLTEKTLDVKHSAAGPRLTLHGG